MLQVLPIILFSNSQKLILLFFQFLPIILNFLPVMLILRKQKMKPHTVVQQKSHCTCRKGVIPAIPYRYLCWMNLGCWNLSYESYTLPFVHAYHVVRAPTLALFLHATPIIPELCPLLVYPYYAGNYASILCAGLTVTLAAHARRGLIRVAWFPVPSGRYITAMQYEM